MVRKDSVISVSERQLMHDSQEEEANNYGNTYGSSIPEIYLDDNETKMNRVFKDTDFTFKSAIDLSITVNPSVH